MVPTPLINDFISGAENQQESLSGEEEASSTLAERKPCGLDGKDVSSPIYGLILIWSASGSGGKKEWLGVGCAPYITGCFWLFELQVYGRYLFPQRPLRHFKVAVFG